MTTAAPRAAWLSDPELSIEHNFPSCRDDGRNLARIVRPCNQTKTLTLKTCRPSPAQRDVYDRRGSIGGLFARLGRGSCVRIAGRRRERVFEAFRKTQDKIKFI